MMQIKLLTVVLGLMLFGCIRPVYAFDHSYSDWGNVLKTYTEDGYVDYGALQKSPKVLDTYLENIQKLEPGEYEKWSKDEKVSFWINAYNAFTVQTIIGHYPKKSIKQISNVWGEKRFAALGKKWSLNQIEHEILRKEFSEPRVHFALVCASLGCPVLRNEPYTAVALSSQLDSQVRDFLSDTSKARYDEKSDTLFLSPIFRWYGEDFEKGGGIIKFILTRGKHYLPPDMEGKITVKMKIKWLGYDWSLNDIRFPSKQ